jgi:hypothetical protein
MAAWDLHAQASALLEACQTILGGRCPATAFVSAGEPAFDCCPMLAVHVPAISEASTSPGGALTSGHRNNFGRVSQTTMIVSIIRCDQEVAAGTLPDPIKKEATAAEVHEDAWTLWNGIYRLIADGVLFHGCSERYLDGARIVDSSGGCVGWRIQVRASIPGYNPLET